MLATSTPTYVSLMICINNITDDSDDGLWVYPNSVIVIVL